MIENFDKNRINSSVKYHNCVKIFKKIALFLFSLSLGNQLTNKKVLL